MFFFNFFTGKRKFLKCQKSPRNDIHKRMWIFSLKLLCSVFATNKPHAFSFTEIEKMSLNLLKRKNPFTNLQVKFCYNSLRKVTTILEKYDPNKGSKAFSYFSVITKNWFIHQVKKTTKRQQREVDYEKALNEVDQSKIICHNPFHKDQEKIG